MSSFLFTAGAVLVCGGILSLFWNLYTYAVLKPTRKSPARPGDMEARKFTGVIIIVDCGLIALGSFLLAVGALTP